MAIKILAGPAGGGKSDVADDMEGGVVVDTTRLFNALFPTLVGSVRTGEDGRLLLTQYVKAVALRQAVESGLDGYVTTSDPAAIDGLLAVTGMSRDDGLIIVDPGRAVVLERLRESQGRDREAACTQAVDRWYSRFGR